MGRLVWAFEPLDETGGDTGFVDMADETLADKLIDAGKVQCGWNPSGGELRHIDGAAVAAYATRQLKAGGNRPAHPVAHPYNQPEASEPEAAPPAPAKPAEPREAGKKRGRPPKADK